MDIDKARDAFCKLVDDLDKEHLADFFSWIQHTYLVAQCRGQEPAIACSKLRDIAEDIKSLVPLNAILPTERIVPPQSESEEDDPGHCVHIDGFLYEEMDIDDLVNEGKLVRNFCQDCHSHNTAPLTFLTHSVSRRRLDFIFDGFLPYLDSSKVIVDVGSRLGAILYGAYYHTEAGKIIGVELNSELCDIQNNIVKKHKLDDRIQVKCNDIRNEKDVLNSADVVVLNNVFEHFMPLQDQISCWKFIAKNLKIGAYILAIPSLEESLLKLDNIGINLKSWVTKRLTTDPLMAMSIKEDDELSEIVTYQVKGSPMV